MRILSWNINGIRAAELKGFLKWFKAESPDILCIQETKSEPGQLSEALCAPVDKEGKPYTVFWSSAKKRGYSGVALYTRQQPRDVILLGDKAFDDEGRVLQADYGSFVLINAYFPNSQEAGARLDYKLAFCAQILKKTKSLVKEGKHIILCGDYNIAHRPIDLARPRENEGNPGYLPEERAWMDVFTASGFVDTFRAFKGDLPAQYTWWSYRGNARARNVGWRLDYYCVDSLFMPNVVTSIIRHDVTGSDHCPVELHIKDK